MLAAGLFALGVSRAPPTLAASAGDQPDAHRIAPGHQPEPVVLIS
jgi:hypothetical protein